MTETKHSPTPWKVSAFNKTNIVDSIGRWVCDCTDPHLETATANTRLIVSAVNGHDKLVKALKNVREEIGMQDDGIQLHGHTRVIISDRTWQTVKEALKLADKPQL